MEIIHILVKCDCGQEIKLTSTNNTLGFCTMFDVICGNCDRVVKVWADASVYEEENP